MDKPAPLALIIGGTNGIGRAIALRFAAEGMRVVVAGRDATRGAAAAAACGGRFLPVDVADPASFAPLSLPAYTPGKQAVKALTEILACELGPRGIRVNALAPGYTLSDGLKARIAAGERNPEAIVATTALRKFVQPEDVAEAALFLCSSRAGLITGVTLPVDAGWLVQAPYAQYLRGNPIKDTP